MIGDLYIEAAEKAGLDPADKRVLDLVEAAFTYYGATTPDEAAAKVHFLIREVFDSVKKSIDAATGDYKELTALQAKASRIAGGISIAICTGRSIDYVRLLDEVDDLARDLERIAPVTYVPTEAGLKAVQR